MPIPLDQAYFWSINPATGKDPSGQAGLGSLIPSPILSNPHPPQPIPDPSVSFPIASVNPGQNFDWVGSGRTTTAPTPNLDPASKPYFDPYFPNESMQALRNWLVPQVAAGGLDALRARGLEYSGVGQYAASDATSYLDQIAPQETPQEALHADMVRLYGPAVTGSLDTASALRTGRNPVTTIPVPSYMPADEARANVVPGLLRNPNSTGPQWAVKIPGSNVTGPQYLASPGYWYDPNHAPDASAMPWLGAAIAPQNIKQVRANV